jgi:rhomboid-like protein
MSAFRFTRPDNFPPVIKNLIIINVLMYVAQLTVNNGFSFSDWVQLRSIMPDELRQLLIKEGIRGSELEFKPHQLITHMFAHSPETLMHIFFNMFTLWMFGKILENVWGSKRFLQFYIACGLGAAALHLGVEYLHCQHLLTNIKAGGPVTAEEVGRSVAGALGASGAVMGVLVAFAYLFPNTELYIMFIPVPVKAKWAVLGLAAFDLFGGVTGLTGNSIAHFAHLGGALTGFLILLYWNKNNRQTLY